VQGTKSVIRLGLARTIIYGVYTVFLAGISPNIRSYTVYIYGSGQPYTYTIPRVGQNHISIYGVYTVFLAEKSPHIRSYTVYIYGSGQPYDITHMMIPDDTRWYLLSFTTSLPGKQF
jgi:hypothetical protein